MKNRRIGSFVCFALAASAALGAASCGAQPVTTRVLPAAPPRLPEQFKNHCDAAKGQLRPLVVEWEAPDRAALESQSKKGLVVVRYGGCELEVLRRCKAPAKFVYAYTSITPKDEVVTIASSEQLYASIPVHAVKFEGKLAQSGRLEAAMKIVGEYGVAGLPPAIDQLEGECDGATHVVTAQTVGAFRFSAGAKGSVGASVAVMGFGAGADAERSADTLSSDGDVKACEVSKRGDAAPPDRCGALLRLELAALLPRGEGIPECAPGTRLAGKKCEAIPKPVELAAQDKGFVDDKRGFGWGTRCFAHLRAGALPNARAACQKGLDAEPDDATRGAILYNFASIEEAAGDVLAACQRFAQSFAARPSAAVEKKLAALECPKVLRR